MEILLKPNARSSSGLMFDEENHLPLGDKAYTIIVSSKASEQEDVPRPLRELFRYMNEHIVAEINDL